MKMKIRLGVNFSRKNSGYILTPCDSCVWLSFQPLIPISHDTISIQWTDFDETCHEYSSCEWELLNRFSSAEVKGQGRDQTNELIMAEADISVVWLQVLRYSFSLLCLNLP